MHRVASQRLACSRLQFATEVSLDPVGNELAARFNLQLTLVHVQSRLAIEPHACAPFTDPTAQHRSDAARHVFGEGGGHGVGISEGTRRIPAAARQGHSTGGRACARPASIHQLESIRNPSDGTWLGRVACVGQAAGKRRRPRSATLPHAIRVLRSGRKIDRFFTRASGTRDEIPVAREKQRETRHFAHEEKLLHRRMIVVSTSCG